MGLRDIVNPVEEVAVGDTSFVVRGLSFADISTLVHRHAQTAAALFAQFMVPGTDAGDAVLGKLATLDYAAIGKSVMKQAPEVIVEVIVLSAAGHEAEAEDYRIIRDLPMPAQMEALDKIGRLTFTSEESLGKLLEMVIRTAGSATRSIKSLQSPSTNGGGASAGK